MDLKAKLIIFKGDETLPINIFEYEGGNAALELASALSHKIGRTCKRCTIKNDPYKNELKINILFIETFGVFRYEYMFTGADLERIDPNI